MPLANKFVLEETASRIKASGGLLVPDCSIGAKAIEYGATLVHKDPEFEPLVEIRQEILKRRA